MVRPLGRSLVAAGLAAAGLGAPIATLAALAGGRIVAAPIAVVCWLALAAYVVDAPRFWPDLSPARARGTLARGEIAAVIALIVGWWVSFGISIDHDLCGHQTSSFIGGAVVYVAAGSLGLQRSRFSTAGWVIAVLLGWAVVIGLLFVLPGARGYCET